MVSFTTANRHGYSVRYSPFDPDILVVASSQYYGLCGAGTLHLLELAEDDLHEIGQVQWNDGLFDVVWSPNTEDVVATSSGDGSLQLWNFRSLETGSPTAYIPAHSAEIYSVDWGNSLSGNKLLTGTHSDVVFTANYSNSISNVFSSVGADGSLIIWDASSPKPLQKVAAHDGEALTCTWNQFNSNVLATGGSDGLIRGWDLRNLTRNVFELYGCEFAVRRIRFSPHFESVLVSAGYDFYTRIWDYQVQFEPLESFTQHSEFVYGVDWNPNRSGQVADCGWDSLVNVFTPKCLENV